MKKSKTPFQFLPHTADIKFVAHGKTLEEAFINSALAVRQTITKSDVREVITKSSGIMADDLESLLQNFLEEIIFLFDSENFIMSIVKNLFIEKDENGYSLRCDFLGDRTTNKDKKGKPYVFEEHIKAITYHDMKVEEKMDGSYEIQVVLDV